MQPLTVKRLISPGAVLLVWIAALLIGVNSPAVAQHEYHPAVDEKLFPVPLTLRPAIAFWRDIFGKYGAHEILIHDDRHMALVYEVVDVSDLVLSGRSAISQAKERRKRVKHAIDRTRNALRVLSGDRRIKVAPEELVRVKKLTQRFGTKKTWYRSARERVRSQSGLRDDFSKAIQISGMFMPGIEEALAAEGLPAEISRLPFVESMFNYKARSKVGASGAWQFTRSTGRLYMRIDSAVDERSDVLLAARGAAKYLRSNYRRVKSWPLALTGYNHGVGGMARAVARLKTRDIGVVVDRYKSRTFGFASRNFYAEFVAAVVVFADRTEIFPGIEQLPRLEFEVFSPEKYVSLLDLAALAVLSETDLVTLNPALGREIVRGDMLIPSGFELKVPKGRLTETLNAYGLIPDDRKRSRQLARQHKVRRGETVGQIARRYGTNIRRIQTANNLPRADRIYIGQVLDIPSSGSGTNWTRRLSGTRLALLKNPPPAPEPGMSSPAFHTVRSGDSLSMIADRYGVSVGTLVQINGLRSPDRLRVGQRVNLPTGSARTDVGEARATVRYTVRAGDTLIRIARLHQTTVRALVNTNSLNSTVLSIGQVLSIP